MSELRISISQDHPELADKITRKYIIRITAGLYNAHTTHPLTLRPCLISCNTIDEINSVYDSKIAEYVRILNARRTEPIRPMTDLVVNASYQLVDCVMLNDNDPTLSDDCLYTGAVPLNSPGYTVWFDELDFEGLDTPEREYSNRPSGIVDTGWATQRSRRVSK